MQKIFLVFSPILLVILFGCAAEVEGPETATAGGTLTYKGQPVAGAMITFHPVTRGQGQTCQIQTDETGQFNMVTGLPGGKQKPGAVPGEYTVTAIKQKMEPGGLPTNELPDSYMSPIKSPLKVTVELGGENEFALELED